ncbi:hypothetical protein QOZ80_4AG0328470 [Eleusine coracana subsp. coracana]|nr:hypothetical protein QOZ80_4AG0328470 [Eleusine coracana subsp. coracana]
MRAEVEATRQKKRKLIQQKQEVEILVDPSPSFGPPVVPEPKVGSPRLPLPETPYSEVDPAVRGKKYEENQAEPAAAALLGPVEEMEGKEEDKKKKAKRRKHGKVVVSLSQSVVARASIFVGEDKTANVVSPAPEQGEWKWRREKEQEQLSQSPLPFDAYSQGGKQATEGLKCESVAVRSSSKKPYMPSNREIIRMRIEARKQQPLPEGLLDAVAKAANPITNSMENNSNHSSPFGAFLDQFRYIPDHRQNCNSPSFLKSAGHPARSTPRGQFSSEPSQLPANGTSKAAKTPILNASVSFSQQEVQTEDIEKPRKKMNGKKKQYKPKPFLHTQEKLSDKYRRLPLDQLVPPPRSPHKLLQEKYASDPWKVIVICMLLNLTQGKQVRKKVKGFFKRYPDPHTAYCADTEKMAKYLTPLGLQRVKTERIQRFSKDYVGNEWTHITQLCGVGKYAADAYAIFCAGRAAEVVPEDHKLVDYWKYVCSELPLIQVSENAPATIMIDQLEKVLPKVQ